MSSQGYVLEGTGIMAKTPAARRLVASVLTAAAFGAVLAILRLNQTPAPAAAPFTAVTTGTCSAAKVWVNGL